MNTQLELLADAICMRIDQKQTEALMERPVAKAKLQAAVVAYFDALGMLLASEQPEYPSMWCPLNIANNPATVDAEGYFRHWKQNGMKTLDQKTRHVSHH